MTGRRKSSKKAADSQNNSTFSDPCYLGEFVSYEQAIKTLEGADLSSESSRVLKRWLSLLKQVGILSAASVEAPRRTVAFVSYYHIENEGVRINFCDVFLRIQVVQGVILSMRIVSLIDTLQVGSERVNQKGLTGWTPLASLCLELKNRSYSRFLRMERPPFVELYEVFDGRAIIVYEFSKKYEGITTLESGQFCKTWVRLLEEIEELCAHPDQRYKIVLPAKMTREGISDSWDIFRHTRVIDGLAFTLNIGTEVDTPTVNGQKVDELQVSKALLANLSRKNEKYNMRFQGEETHLAEENVIAEIEKEVVEFTGLEAKRVELEASLRKVQISLAASYRRLVPEKEEVDSTDIGRDTQSDHQPQNRLLYFMAREFVLEMAKKNELLSG